MSEAPRFHLNSQPRKPCPRQPFPPPPRPPRRSFADHSGSSNVVITPSLKRLLTVQSPPDPFRLSAKGEIKREGISRGRTRGEKNCPRRPTTRLQRILGPRDFLLDSLAPSAVAEIMITIFPMDSPRRDGFYARRRIYLTRRVGASDQRVDPCLFHFTVVFARVTNAD